MTSIAVGPRKTGLIALAEAVGLELEPFQHKVVRAVNGPQGETLILVPRGAGKTTLMALVALHHLLTVEDAKVYCVAASVPQARILFEAAADFARRLDHPNIVFRHLELRWCPDPDEPTVFTRHMRVLGAEGPRLHGLSPTLMILDELQAVTREDIYAALGSALHKRPDSKLVIISTAGQGVDTPLGQLRQRALGLPEVKLEDVREVKKANPASWLTAEALREQRERLPDLAFRRFIANQSPRLVRRAQTRLTG